LFLRKEGIFSATQNFEIVPIINLNVEIHVDTPILLHNQKTKHICSLYDGVVGIEHIVLFDQFSLFFLSNEPAVAVIIKALLKLLLVLLWD
jgi:hypothetical protein